LVVPPINDVEAFLAGLRFEKRNLLAKLPSDLFEDRLNKQGAVKMFQNS
jgi:hypothetical protein